MLGLPPVLELDAHGKDEKEGTADTGGGLDPEPKPLSTSNEIEM
jgi:hypothetical protein